ncbi:MAG: hypothetical protein DRP11_05465, partial [Candidatus Aenigmatarchaeota archaeon]
MEESVITYETFRKFSRREVNNEKLQELPPSFYRACSEWLRKKGEQLDPRDPLAVYEIENAKKEIIKILEKRESKILKMAVDAVRINAAPVNLTPEEKKFFDSVVEILRRFRSELMESVLSSNYREETEENLEEKEPEKEESEEGGRLEEDGEIEETKERKRFEIEKKTDGILVRFVKDLPKFVGPD